MDYSRPSSSVLGILQARILEWVAMTSSRGSSQSRDQTCIIQQWPHNWKRSVFIPIPKKCNAKECSNYHTVALISHTSKVMLKILWARLQQYMNRELPDVQAGFSKGRGTKYQCQHPLDHRKSKKVPEKHLFLLYWLFQSLWLCGSQ